MTNIPESLIDHAIDQHNLLDLTIQQAIEDMPTSLAEKLCDLLSEYALWLIRAKEEPMPFKFEPEEPAYDNEGWF